MPTEGHLVVRSGGGIRDVGVLLRTASTKPDRGESGHEEERQSPDEASCRAEGPVRQRGDLHNSPSHSVCRFISIWYRRSRHRTDTSDRYARYDRRETRQREERSVAIHQPEYYP